MAEAPAFIVANLVVTDKDRYREYEKGFFPILKKHGGEFFTTGSSFFFRLWQQEL